MRTLIYKRTHSNDPDPETGVFGNRDCMGQVRAWEFDAVIGIGGVGDEPKRHGIAGKLTWIGIGPQRFFDDPDSRGPQLVFQHFKYFGEDGPLLVIKYPALARHMYDTHRRLMIHLSSSEGPSLDHDVELILRLAKNSPPSPGPAERKAPRLRNKCRPRAVRRATC
jgi:hypothetical protein